MTASGGLHASLVAALREFAPVAPQQRELRDAWLSLAADERLLTRAAAPQHFTASCFTFTPDQSHVLLVLHKKLGKWLQPGGHIESQDVSVEQSASRELREETGLELPEDPKLTLLHQHPAPCSSDVDWHLDLQFVAQHAITTPACSDESVDVRWFSRTEVARLRDCGTLMPDIWHTLGNIWLTTTN